VRDACRRAGVERVGVHPLRHALASELLREGASLIDIGQVLRHKYVESTAPNTPLDTPPRRLANPAPRVKSRGVV
jgi:integrase/recombinase XerD